MALQCDASGNEEGLIDVQIIDVQIVGIEIVVQSKHLHIRNLRKIDVMVYSALHTHSMW